MKKEYLYGNLGIGIANAVWIGGIITLIILTNASLWLLVVPILFNWDFIKPDKSNKKK